MLMSGFADSNCWWIVQMEGEQISQFEDQPVIPDSVFEYTEALSSSSVPIVIDNGTIVCNIYANVLLKSIKCLKITKT